MIIKHKIFQQVDCIRYADVMNNITIINTFNSGNSNVTNIKT